MRRKKRSLDAMLAEEDTSSRAPRLEEEVQYTSEGSAVAEGEEDNRSFYRRLKDYCRGADTFMGAVRRGAGMGFVTGLALPLIPALPGLVFGGIAGGYTWRKERRKQDPSHYSALEKAADSSHATYESS